jgi:hypothetical protein
MVPTFWVTYDKFNADKICTEVALTGSSQKENNSNNGNRLLSKLNQAVTLLTCIREMPGSNLGRDIGCPN